MRLYVKAVLWGLTLTSLQHGITARALPKEGISLLQCTEDSCKGRLKTRALSPQLRLTVFRRSEKCPPTVRYCREFSSLARQEDIERSTRHRASYNTQA
jgi:hypothetical protein